MQKVKDPAPVVLLLGKGYLKGAWAIVLNEGLRQQKVERVQDQQLAPAWGAVVVLAKDRAGKVNATPFADDACLNLQAGRRRLPVRTEMAVGSVEE